MVFATAKATSVKSLATGLSDRFLSVKRHIGFRVTRMSTAIAVSDGCFWGSLRIAPGCMVRNGPFAASTVKAYQEGVLTVARGTSSPCAAKALRVRTPNWWEGGHNAHGSSIKSPSLTPRRRAHRLCLPQTTASSSWNSICAFRSSSVSGATSAQLRVRCCDVAVRA
jgi:hypothetical protein